MKKKEAITFLAVRTLGNFLLLFSLYGVAATFGPAVMEEAQYYLAQIRGIEYKVVAKHSSSTLVDDTRISEPVPSETPARAGFAEIIAGNKEQILLPPDTTFSMVIPKIGASTKIFPNIDPGDPNAFLPVLQQGIAHAKGTVFPGMKGNVYLFAHSADNWWNVGRYNAVFYLLKNLEHGDQITIFFENRRYEYAVSEKKIVPATDVSLIASDHSGPNRLILQTCWPPGTTWERLFVIAELSGTTN